MKKYFLSLIGKIKTDQLLRGSLIVFLGSTVTSAINYLYHMVLGRMLGPADYGIFASLLSLTYVYGIPVSVLNLVSLKYISSLRQSGGVDKAAGFFNWFGKKILFFSLFLFLFSLVISPLVTGFLRLPSVFLVLLANVVTIIGIYGGYCSSVIQGFLRFGITAFVSVSSSIFKIIFAVFFVYLGWRVTGVLFSQVISSLFFLFLVTFFIKNKISFPKGKIKEIRVPEKEMLKYAIPVLFSSLALTSFYTTDILLVKNLFPANEAGLYASMAILGKIVFFASSSIGMVMFPLVAGKRARGENYRRIYLNSFLLVVFVSFSITAVYFLFPELMVNLLFGSQYLAIAPLLGLFAIFMSFYALVYLTVNFFLAAAKTAMIVLPLIGAVLQIVLIFLFHTSLRQVVLINIYVMAGLFFSLFALPLKKYVSSGQWRNFTLFGMFLFLLRSLCICLILEPMFQLASERLGGIS